VNVRVLVNLESVVCVLQQRPSASASPEIKQVFSYCPLKLQRYFGYGGMHHSD